MESIDTDNRGNHRSRSRPLACRQVNGWKSESKIHRRHLDSCTTLLGTWIHGLLGFIVTLIVWLALIKHFFDTGWMKALLLAIVLVIVLVIVGLILAALGIAMIAGFGAITGIFG